MVVYVKTHGVSNQVVFFILANFFIYLLCAACYSYSRK